MARAILVLAAAAVTVGGIMAVLDDLAGGLLTLLILLVVGGAALAGAEAAARRRGRLGPLGRQFGVAVLIAVGQVLVAVLAAVTLMFVSGHDALVVLLIVAFAGLAAAVAAQRLAGAVLRDVETVRDGLAAVGEGRRDVTIRTTGHDELAELAAAAEAMVSRLVAEEAARDRAEGARRDLIAAVSHDLRTPITSLQLLAEAVADDILDDETRATYIARMGTHIRALSVLIDDLFELSRLEAGDIRWSVEQVHLGELVGETVAAMRPQADAKLVAVLADVAEPLAPARANPEKVQRVLFNLIQNAIRHTPADGSVTVRAVPGDGGGLEIEVADTGEGIAEAERPRIFDAFFRGGDEAARTHRGSGLGLAIARAIVEAHGGRIWLEGAAAGTRVRFTLPAG